MEDKDPLELIVTNLLIALEKTASNGDAVHRDYAGHLLQVVSQYRNDVRLRALAAPMTWRVDPRTVVNLTYQAASAAKSNRWQDALEQSHLALSVLPGEPGGLPITPPPLPW